MKIEDSFRRIEIYEDLERKIRGRLNQFLAPFGPESNYAKTSRSDTLAQDLMDRVLRKEGFLYHPSWENEKVYIIYQGEVFDYSTEIKKLISEALKHLGISRNKNKIADVYYHIHLNTQILEEKLNILENYITTRNHYVLDRVTGEFLQITFKNLNKFYSLFSRELGPNDRIIEGITKIQKLIEYSSLDQQQLEEKIKTLGDMIEWKKKEREDAKTDIRELEIMKAIPTLNLQGAISEDTDLSYLEEVKELWFYLVSLLPWPIKLPVDYDPNAKAPRWEQFLNEVMDKKYHTAIKRYIGYALYPKVLSKFPDIVVLLGEGSNGKSVFLQTIEAIFGERHISHIPIQELSGRFSKAPLVKKLLNIAGELPKKGIKDTGYLKEMTGGDTVMVEEKYKQPHPAKIYAKHIYSSNELPETFDKTYAFYRRWMIFIFPRTFKDNEADSMLLDKLLKELPGIFNWVLEGYKEFLEAMDFGYPHTVEEIMDMYELASNSLNRFINEECEEAPGEIIPFSEFYKLYYAFCSEHNLTPKADTVVGRELKKVASYVESDRKKINGKKTRVLCNIKVNYIPISERQNIIAEMERRFGFKFDESQDTPEDENILVKAREDLKIALPEGNLEMKNGEIKKIPTKVAKILIQKGKVDPMEA